jgi:2-hydroxy-3-keto-5-methylthiopentenyl-1-phosphate phosphatase
MPMPSPYIVFTDFDGTVTRNDIGDSILMHFGDAEKCKHYYREYLAGMLDAQKCWQGELATIPSLTVWELEEFVVRQELDPGFHDFADFCRQRSIPMAILSDGYDSYIELVLRREGMLDIPYFSNHMVFEADGRITPEFPHTDAECRDCANCKRNHVLTRSSDNQVIVYIGDGYSDRCPARYADIVFAKRALLAFCERENITYHRFDTFADVLTRFRLIVDTAKPKKRRTAELARKEVFMQG